MLDGFPRSVSVGSEFSEPLGGGSFIGQPRESSQGGVEVGLRLLERGLSFSGFPLGRSAALHVSQGLFGLLDRVALRDLGTDRDPPRTVPNGRAAVDGIAVVVGGPDDHPRPAGPAPQDPQAGQEPLGLGPPASRDPHALDRLPHPPADDRLVGLGVDKLPEPELAEVDAAGKQVLDPVIGAGDTGFIEEPSDLCDSFPFCAHPECLSDEGCAFRGDELALLFFVAGGDVREGDPALCDRHRLRLSGALPDASPVVLTDSAQHRSTQPLDRGAAGHLPEVNGEDPAARGLHSADHFLLDGERSHEPVEVGDDQGVGPAALNREHGFAEALPSVKGSPPRDVDLLSDLDKLEALTDAILSDSAALLRRAECVLATLRLADDPDGPDAAGDYPQSDRACPHGGVETV